MTCALTSDSRAIADIAGLGHIAHMADLSFSYGTPRSRRRAEAAASPVELVSEALR